MALTRLRKFGVFIKKERIEKLDNRPLIGFDNKGDEFF
jgi:hypothetical protein